MKINATNLKAIEAAIISAEGKATARTTDAACFPDWIKSAEKRLHELDIPKKYWTGCVITHHPEEVVYSSVTWLTTTSQNNKIYEI
jgi:hypothetical protein